MRDALSPPCVTQKKAARDPEGEKHAAPPGFHAAIFFFTVFFRVTHDGLSERGTTRSLIPYVLTVYFTFLNAAIEQQM